MMLLRLYPDVATSGFSFSVDDDHDGEDDDDSLMKNQERGSKDVEQGRGEEQRIESEQQENVRNLTQFNWTIDSSLKSMI